MPRSSGGTYTLYTPGNPVVPSTVISSTWANNTLTDLATAMTDSLSRSGDGAMLAPLQLVDGNASGPGLTWGTETSSGLYREASNQFSFSISGSKKLGMTTTALSWQAASDASLSVLNTLNSITGAFATDNTNTRVTLGATTNHGLALLTNALARLTISNAGAVAIPGTLDVTGTLTGTTVAASTAITIAGTSVRDATNLFTTGTVPAARLPSSFAGLANPTGTIGLTAVNGSAATAIRSDGAPALSQAIVPTWTGLHTFTNASVGLLLQSATTTGMQLNQTGAAADNRLWDQIATSAQLQHRAVNDAQSVANSYLTVTRSGASISAVNIPNGTLQYGGLEVGYRDLITNTQSGNYTVVAGDRGKSVVYSGTGGHTFTFDTTTANDSIVNVINSGSGNLTIAGSGVSIFWFAGTGSVAGPASRTLAVGGVATIQKAGTGNARIWGVGLS